MYKTRVTLSISFGLFKICFVFVPDPHRVRPSSSPRHKIKVNYNLPVVIVNPMKCPAGIMVFSFFFLNIRAAKGNCNQCNNIEK